MRIGKCNCFDCAIYYMTYNVMFWGIILSLEHFFNLRKVVLLVSTSFLNTLTIYIFENFTSESHLIAETRHFKLCIP